MGGKLTCLRSSAVRAKLGDKSSIPDDGKSFSIREYLLLCCVVCAPTYFDRSSEVRTRVGEREEINELEMKRTTIKGVHWTVLLRPQGRTNASNNDSKETLIPSYSSAETEQNLCFVLPINY